MHHIIGTTATIIFYRHAIVGVRLVRVAGRQSVLDVLEVAVGLEVAVAAESMSAA